MSPGQTSLVSGIFGLWGTAGGLDGKMEAGIRQKMLRKGKNHDPLKIELYDLAADLSETEDLASKHPDIVEKIRKMMMDQHVPSKEFPIAVID